MARRWEARMAVDAAAQLLMQPNASLDLLESHCNAIMPSWIVLNWRGRWWNPYNLTRMQFAKGEVIFDKYRVLFPIKDGRNAETYRVLDDTGKLCFLKMFNPASIQSNELDGDGVLKELSLVKKINHPGVPRLVESERLRFEAALCPLASLSSFLERRCWTCGEGNWHWKHLT